MEKAVSANTMLCAVRSFLTSL